MDSPTKESVGIKNDANGEKGPRRRVLSAAKLIGKKFPSTTRLVVSSKIWMHTIPTRDCDVLMTFPPNTNDQSLMWLLARLRSRTPELGVHVRHHSNSGVFGFYLTASYENLLKGAEDLGIRKKMKTEFGGGLKEFLVEEAICFEGVEDQTTFLSSQERQSIVLHMLNNLRAVKDDELMNIKFLEGQAIIPKCVSKGIISQLLPLHNNDSLGELQKNWVKAFIKYQPLDSICEYFGVKIALYFAWLGHYTKALFLPAVAGMILWFFCYGGNQVIEDVSFVVFALFNTFWSTLYLESWKRRCAELAYRWGTLDKQDELLVEPRPLFSGHLQVSQVTGRLEPVYSTWRRNLFRYFVSFPVILVCLGVVFGSMLAIFELQEWWNKKVLQNNYPHFVIHLPKILLAVVINVLDDIYKKIAFWLNDKENYRLEETYENHLIVKLVLFQFVNSFLSLFYIGFYLEDMDRLKEQLAALLITRQVLGNIKEAFVPYVIERYKFYKMTYELIDKKNCEAMKKRCQDIDCTSGHGSSSGSSSSGESEQNSPETETPLQKELKDHGLQHDHSGPTLTQAEVESAMTKYDGTFEDYLEMFIQFGYITLFSSAFPMAAMCALMNNLIEIRSDAFKLCCTFQRPFGQRVENIGTWQDALDVLTVIAVVVNCALIGVSGQIHRLIPGLDTTKTILLIIVLEHIILILKFAIAYAIPDVPQWVATEMAKVEYQRREALRRLEAAQTSQALGRDPEDISLPGSPQHKTKNENVTVSVPVITKTIGVQMENAESAEETEVFSNLLDLERAKSTELLQRYFDFSSTAFENFEITRTETVTQETSVSTVKLKQQ